MLHAVCPQLFHDRRLLIRQRFRGQLPHFLMGLPIGKVGPDRRVVIHNAINHVIVAFFALQVQLRVAKVVFRRLEGLARKQDFPTRGELLQNTFPQAGKFHILIHRQPPVQHFLL